MSEPDDLPPVELLASRAQLIDRLERAHLERTRMAGTIGDLRRELADAHDALQRVRETAETASCSEQEVEGEYGFGWNTAMAAVESALGAQQAAPCARTPSDEYDLMKARAERAEAALDEVKQLADRLDAEEAYGGRADGYREAAASIREAALGRPAPTDSPTDDGGQS